MTTLPSWTAPGSCAYTVITLDIDPDVTGTFTESTQYKYAVPLTTVFTHDLGCRPPLEDLASSACWPSLYYRVWDNGGFFSPGICPSSYTVGCTGSGYLNGVVIQAGETAGICIPR